MEVIEKVLTRLDNLNIDYQLIKHKPVYTIGEINQPVPTRPHRQRRTWAVNRRSGLGLRHGRHHRAYNRRNYWRHRCRTRWATAVVVAYGMEYVAHLPHFRISELCTKQFIAYCEPVCVHRAIWLWFWVHRLHTLPHLLLRRAAQDSSLRHLHRVHGSRHDVAGNGRRMAARGHRVPTLFYMDHDMLRRHHRCVLVGENRPRIREKTINFAMPVFGKRLYICTSIFQGKHYEYRNNAINSTVGNDARAAARSGSSTWYATFLGRANMPMAICKVCHKHR